MADEASGPQQWDVQVAGKTYSVQATTEQEAAGLAFQQHLKAPAPIGPPGTWQGNTSQAQQVRTITSPPGFYQQHVLPAILPTAGAVGGAMVGTALGGPGGGYVGEAVGGGGGEAFNQMLGITEPSPTQIGLAGAAPMGGRLVGAAAGRGVQLGARMLPGAGPALQDLGVTTARALPNFLKPIGETVDQLYARVSALGGPRVETPHLASAVEELLASEAKVQAGLRNTQLQTTLKGLQTMTGGGQGMDLAVIRRQLGFAPGEALPARLTEEIAAQAPQAAAAGVPFDVLRANLKRLGDRIGALRAQGGEEYGAYKKLFSAIQDDFDQAITRPGIGGGAAEDAATALRTANKAARREFAANSLADVIEAKVMTSENRGFIQFSPGKVLDWLRKSDEGQQVVKSMTPEEFSKLTGTLKDLTRVPRIGPGAGAEFGSGRSLFRGALGSLGGAAFGGPQGAAIGGALGVVASPLIAKALMTETGQALLKRAVIEGGGSLEAKWLPALAAAARAETTSPGSAVAVGPEASAAARGGPEDPLGIR